jgi:hypothetical protein
MSSMLERNLAALTEARLGYVAFWTLTHKSSGKGLRVVGVSMEDDGWKAVKPFIKTAKALCTIVLASESLGKAYQIKSMPDTYLIDRRGRLAAVYTGLADKENIETNIRAMLAEQ